MLMLKLGRFYAIYQQLNKEITKRTRKGFLRNGSSIRIREFSLGKNMLR